MAEEEVIFQGTGSHKADMVSHICWGLLGVLTFGVGLLINLYIYLKRKTTVYTITNERIRVKTGILSKHTEELELYRVRDTKHVVPFIMGLMGLSRIVVASSDISTPVMLIDGIPNGEQLREQLRNHVERLRSKKGVKEVQIA